MCGWSSSLASSQFTPDVCFPAQVEAEVGEKLVQETYFDIIEKQDFDPVAFGPFPLDADVAFLEGHRHWLAVYLHRRLRGGTCQT